MPHLETERDSRAILRRAIPGRIPSAQSPSRGSLERRVVLSGSPPMAGDVRTVRQAGQAEQP
jgi:hypothetical protein